VQLKSYSLDEAYLKVGLPSWWALLNCNLALNCVGSSRRFSSQFCKMESACIVRLARVFHSWLSSEQGGVLLEICNKKWKDVCGISLLQLVFPWPWQAYCNVKPSWTQVLPYSSLVHLLWLMTTGVSTTLTKCTPCCLCYHRSLSLWFHKILWMCPSSFLPSSGVNADSTLKLVSVCKFSSIIGTIPTLEFRKWSRLPSCRWDQWSFFIFWGLSSFVISGWDFFRGMAITP
jgi:hypothetical protein